MQKKGRKASRPVFHRRLPNHDLILFKVKFELKAPFAHAQFQTYSALEPNVSMYKITSREIRLTVGV